MTKPIDQRRSDRILIGGRVEIGWTDDKGVAIVARGKCVDFSEGGMKIEVRERIPNGTRVNVRAPEAGLHGSGSVRHCRATKGGYHAGIEFLGGLKRQQKEPERP